MSYSWNHALVAIFCVACLTSWGCRKAPSPSKRPNINPLAAAKAAMNRYDTNKDARISAEELRKQPAFKMAMKKVVGDITVEKIAARVRKWQESPEVLMSVVCTVRLNSRPVSGAVVKFVPEVFLAKDIPAARGVTDENGRAVISVPIVGSPGPGNMGGVFCGFYQVEISREENGQEIIPAKYNTETTLGLEVAPDAEGIREGILFNLDSLT